MWRVLFNSIRFYFTRPPGVIRTVCLKNLFFKSKITCVFGIKIPNTLDFGSHLSCTNGVCGEEPIYAF